MTRTRTLMSICSHRIYLNLTTSKNWIPCLGVLVELINTHLSRSLCWTRMLSPQWLGVKVLTPHQSLSEFFHLSKFIDESCISSSPTLANAWSSEDNSTSQLHEEQLNFTVEASNQSLEGITSVLSFVITGNTRESASTGMLPHPVF